MEDTPIPTSFFDFPASYNPDDSSEEEEEEEERGLVVLLVLWWVVEEVISIGVISQDLPLDKVIPPSFSLWPFEPEVDER